MALKTQGQAGTSIDFLDFSFLLQAGLLGITAVLGITERGEIGKPVLVGTWQEYQENFGGLQDDNIFPLLCRRILERGGRILVSPVAHYLDISDKTSLFGTKASVAVDEALQAAMSATSTNTISGTVTVGETVVVRTDGITLGAYTVSGGDDASAITTGLVADVNTNTSAHGYSAAVSGSDFVLTAPSAQGASVNGNTVVLYTTDNTGTLTANPFAGGVTAAGAVQYSVEASSIGDWANGKLWYSIAPAANGAVDQFDVTVGLDGYPTLTTTVPNLSKDLNTDDLTVLNLRQRLVKFDVSTFSGEWRETPKTYFTGGVKDNSAVTVTDYIGSQIASTGLHAFDDQKMFVKIAAPAYADPELDAAIEAYVNMRKDCLGALRTPVGLDSRGIIEYREGEGAYQHNAIDNWRLFMTTGGLLVNHPEKEAQLQIPELGDVLGLMGKKDNQQFPWYSAAGQKRGRIPDSLAVVYDLGSTAREAQADLVSLHQVNAVIDHESFGIVFWDNLTLSKKPSLFKWLNVAELLIYLYRTIKPITEQELFDPNDIETWKAIYRKVFVVMEFVKDNRGVWDYKYEGDQNIETIEQAAVNSPDAIDSGQYQFNLFLQPKVGAKFIGMRGIVTNSGVDFSELDV